MKARKLLSLILCAVMVFIAAPASIYADEVQTPEVYVDSVSADPGSDVTVYVGIRNAADLGGLGVKVFYDPDVFTVSSADAGSFVAGASVAVNTSTAGTVSESIIDMNGLNGDGDLMAINFHVDADASPGDYELAVGIDDALDISFNNISVKKQAGSISVKKAETKPKQVSFYSYFESSGTLRIGDELHYKVNCYDANGLAGGTFTFEYDSSILEFVDAALGDELISDTAIYSVNSNNPGIVKISYAEIEPITTQSDTVFFDITFKAKQKTDASSVTFSGSSLLDSELNEMMTWGASSNVSIGDIASRLRTEWDGEAEGDRKFTVDVLLTEGSNVGAGDFWISYDTSMLTCESVVTDDAVGESGAYLVTKEDTSGGKISFSYVNSKGCSQDTALLHITFKQNHGVTGDTTLETGGKDVVDKAMKDVVLEYPTTSVTMPYEYHEEEVMPAVEPTCEETGLTEGKKCSICGEILVEQETVAALGHDYLEDSGSAVEATCETAGKEADMKCSRCGSVIEGKPIEALGHIWSDWTVTKEASCTEDGEEQRICSRDESHVETRKIDAKGHTIEVIPAVPATCEETGLTEGKKCSVCGEILVEQETVAALGHDLEKIESKAVSCTEDGNIEYWTCSRCGKYFSDESGETEISLEDTVIKTDGHKEDVIPAVPATCDEPGLTEGKKCSVCGEILVEQETVAALGHDLEKINGKPVSCTEDGSLEYWTCSRCGKYFSDEAGETEISLEDTVIKATGHDYAEGIVTKDPTDEEEGEITIACKNCDHSYTKPIPKLDADQAAAYEAVNSADEKVKQAKSQVDKLTEDSSEQTLTDTDLLVAESLEAAEAAVKAAEAAAQKTEAEYGADSDAAKYAQTKLDQAKKAYADASVAAATVKAAIAESAAKKAEEAKKKADTAAATPGTAAAKAAETSLTAAQDAAEKAQAAKDAADAALSAIVAAGYSTDSDEYKAAANAVTSADTRLTEAKAAAEAAEKAKTKADNDAKLEADRQGKRDKKIPKVKGVKVKSKKATITVRWKRFTSKQLKKSKSTKYEIWVCPNTKFRKADTKIYTVGKKKSSKVCKGLKLKKAYYVKVRAIKKVKGVKYVGPWSARKKIKTK